jgi:Tfp pilus assembly protein PilP
MSENIHIDILDRLSQGWGQPFNNDASGIADDCYLSEKTIAHVMGDLSADEIDIIAGHLHKCHFCVNLIIDLRMADEESRESVGEFVELLPALADAIQKTSRLKPTSGLKPTIGRQPTSVRRSALNPFEKLVAIISKIWSSVFAPRILVPLATACLAFFIIHYGLSDTDTRIQYQTIRKKIETPKDVNLLPAKTPSPAMVNEKPSARELSEIRKKTVQNDTTIYSISPLHEDQLSVRPENFNSARVVPQAPLVKLDLNQLKLVGIIISSEGNIAVLEDYSGKGYIVEEGAQIGSISAKVLVITKDRILIEEQASDTFGKKSIRQRELKLHAKD